MVRNEGERVRDYTSGNRIGPLSRSHARQWVRRVGGFGGGGGEGIVEAARLKGAEWERRSRVSLKAFANQDGHQGSVATRGTTPSPSSGLRMGGVEGRGVWGCSDETLLSDNAGDGTINRSDSLSEWKFADQATDVRGGFFFLPAPA